MAQQTTTGKNSPARSEQFGMAIFPILSATLATNGNASMVIIYTMSLPKVKKNEEKKNKTIRLFDLMYLSQYYTI